MRNLSFHFSAVRAGVWSATFLVVVYIALIATVMSYATLTIEYSQSVKNDEALLAKLESLYLAEIATIETTDYLVAGYTKPSVKTFVPTQSATALR